MTEDPRPALLRQAALVAALTAAARYPHPVASVRHLETHISHILLAGEYAYKLKKPLDLGFVDYSSLEQRRECCAAEVRLNRRLAPELYLDCIPICGSADNPVLQGDPAAAIEFAVRMRRFPQQALLDRCLAQGRLTPRHLEASARRIAAFHAAVARSDAASPWGAPEMIRRTALDNFSHCRALLEAPADRQRLDALQIWTEAAWQRLEGVFAARRAGGLVRECHGDLHLGNMILNADGSVTVFDCIEFNAALRWIDVQSEAAFLFMDLCRRHAPDLAWGWLNAYLESSGDYEGLAAFAFYRVYRALVRAKIAAIRHAQTGQDADLEDCRGYLSLAQAFTRPPPPFLLITHGVSGSGKSFITGRLAPALEAVRLRSDVERKRLFGLDPLAHSGSALAQGIYTDEAGGRTYARLLELAGAVLDGGFPVLVDAAFLDAGRRAAFRALAKDKGVPFVLLACGADPALLRERIIRRAAQGDDATEADAAVLERQLADYAPPAAEEQPLAAGAGDIAALSAAVRERTGGV
ncbi:MAG: AAA family ATPase [Pseudomonadota bacterium]|nr:AAA family ATPase [Pseudomonadota bacterium]